MDPARAPIFVIGTGRSGTTLLRFMLCAHPRIYITHEASFYVWERVFGKRAFLERYFETHSFRWLRLDPERVTEKLSDPPRLSDTYTAVMREKAAQYGRPRWGDKTPSHAAHLKQIFADYPDARVVHIVRDPRGVALSLSRMPWASPSLFANVVFCEIERRQVHRFRDRILQIRLEDLLADPRTTMTRVLDHVGEPWDDAVLDHPNHVPATDDMPPFPWLEGAARARGAPAASWREAMTPLEIRMVEREARKIMREHGYPRAELTPADEPGRLRRWWAGVKEYPRVLHTLGVYLKISRLSRDPRNFEGPAMQAQWKRLNPGSWAHYPGFTVPSPPPLSASRTLPP